MYISSRMASQAGDGLRQLETDGSRFGGESPERGMETGSIDKEITHPSSHELFELGRRRTWSGRDRGYGDAPADARNRDRRASLRKYRCQVLAVPNRLCRTMFTILSRLPNIRFFHFITSYYVST